MLPVHFPAVRRLFREVRSWWLTVLYIYFLCAFVFVLYFCVFRWYGICVKKKFETSRKASQSSPFIFYQHFENWKWSIWNAIQIGFSLGKVRVCLDKVRKNVIVNIIKAKASHIYIYRKKRKNTWCECFYIYETKYTYVCVPIQMNKLNSHLKGWTRAHETS